MQDAFNSILPVATLLLGAALANFLKFSELRKRLRLDAADQLAELPALLWDKEGPDAWLKMNAAVSRLSIRLDLAGVDPELTERVRDTAIRFWQSVYKAHVDEAGDDVWTTRGKTDEDWTEASTAVAAVLGTNSAIKSWWIERRIRKQLKKWDELDRALIASLDKADG